MNQHVRGPADEPVRHNVEDEEDDVILVPEDEEEEEAEGGGVALEEPSEPDETSLEEILTKKPEERPAPEEDDDEDSVLSLGRDERLETLSVKVIPQQPTEFMCRKCYLVKHRSQLADKKRMYCRDCA
jgi:hypothetical protein